MSKSIRQIHLKKNQCLTDKETDKFGGKFLENEQFSLLLEESADVYKPDGTPLIIFRKGILSKKACRAAYSSLRGAATVTDNRGYASGLAEQDEAISNAVRDGKARGRIIKKDGTVSRTSRAFNRTTPGMRGDTDVKPIKSGIVGYWERNARFPYCRMTAFNANTPELFAKAMPLILEINEKFKELHPERYKAQLKIAQKSPDFIIQGTAFSTITVNKNWRTACHKDKGDFEKGFGVMTAFRAGEYTGGYLVFPKFRVAVDMRTTDLLLADVHEWHGNSPLIGIEGFYERLSLVMYYRQNMRYCGSAEEELNRVKTRKKGDPLKI